MADAARTKLYIQNAAMLQSISLKFKLDASPRCLTLAPVSAVRLVHLAIHAAAQDRTSLLPTVIRGETAAKPLVFRLVLDLSLNTGQYSKVYCTVRHLGRTSARYKTAAPGGPAYQGSSTAELPRTTKASGESRHLSTSACESILATPYG